MKKVYLDNAATTPIHPEVITAMMNVLQNDFGNPSSTHTLGQEAKTILEETRRKIAHELHVSPAEIIYTSCGTEANNLILKSAVEDLKIERIITTELEHKCVAESVENLKNSRNVEVIYLNVNEKGDVDIEQLQHFLKSSDKKTLVSLMHANNEIGNLLDLDKVANICKENGAYFHSDTVQTMAHLPLDFSKTLVDFASCSAHKFHGPKGIGFLYVNKNVKAEALIHGGAQERGLRGGTENVYGIVGLAKAMDLAYEDVVGHQHHVQGLKSYMIEQLKGLFSDIAFHGETDAARSLYTVLNVCFPRTDKAGMLLFTLDLKGVAVSGGSACSSGAAKGSHVLEGIHADMTRPNVRFSFSRYTTQEEIDFALEQVKVVFEKTLA